MGISIGKSIIDEKSPVYIVAEMSANHLKDFKRAIEIIHIAKEAGANAIKLQTYKPDTITLDSDKECFLATGKLWKGTKLYDLYKDAYTPWEWHAALCEEANKIGIDCFSSPFDFSAVDLMTELSMPAFKIASYEITDIPLIKYCASKGKPIIIATGVAEKEDIERAIKACKEENNDQIILLKCVSQYPTRYENVNLNMITDLKEKYGTIVGLSDHSMGSTVPIAAVALGAKMIEKHLTIKRGDGGPDGAFSMEAKEFEKMVKDIRITESALGDKEYHLTEDQIKEKAGARSLFISKDIKKGELLSKDNIKSVRPGIGLHPSKYYEVLGKKATHDLFFADPLKEEDYE